VRVPDPHPGAPHDHRRNAAPTAVRRRALRAGRGPARQAAPPGPRGPERGRMTASNTRVDEPGAGRGESGGFELGISAELTELAKVRHWVRTVLRGFPANVVSTAVMVVDELTSNALRHGRAPYHVRLLPGAAKLRIE